jgi:recombination protein RecA
LTEKPENQASIGSLVSLRAHTYPIRRKGRHYQCRARIIKDKRQGPGWSHAEVYHGPDGLC